MNASTIFQAANSFAMIGWLFLLIFPNWKYTKASIVTGIVLVLAFCYSFFILKDIATFNPNSFNTIEGVKLLFQKDEALLAGWIHYLAFDLFTGLYIVENAPKYGISRLIVSIILPFTFMFGPMGLALFFTVKTIKSAIKS